MEEKLSHLLPATRRAFIKAASAAGLLTLAGDLHAAQAAPQQTTAPAAPGLGEWQQDEQGLPCYRYLGPIRFHEKLRDGSPADAFLTDDPWFLLGNYRLNLFVHASGMLQILSGERSWARLNQGDPVWGGVNHASVTVDGTRHELVGQDSFDALAAEKLFGVGFARYSYKVGASLEVTRLISVKPSNKVNEGTSGFVVEVTLKNTASAPAKVEYAESVGARYGVISREEKKLVSFTSSAAIDDRHDFGTAGTSHEGHGFARVDFTAHSALPLPRRGEMSPFDAYPASLFVRPLSGGDALRPTAAGTGNTQELGVKEALTLAAGETRRFSFIVGYTRESGAEPVLALATAMTVAHASPAIGGLYGAEWRKIVPAFADEHDTELRREMQWNVAVLEQMAIYREYYDETIVPQGTIYDYVWGQVLSNRDWAQHALPLCHTNPALAKSVLRFIMKRIMPDGEIKLNEEAVGWASHGPMLTSDQQLYFFMLLAEYLRATGDASILSEELHYYPVECSGRGSGLQRIKQSMSFLRDRIGTGKHGLVRMWNSDWNDMFYWWPTKSPYGIMFIDSESHMNSAMAIVLVAGLADALESKANGAAVDAGEVAAVVAAMRAYRAQVLDAFMKDLGTREFPRRAYFGETNVGEDEMWLEPQGFALQIPELALDRKRKLFAEAQRRLIAGEALGPRQVEKPVAQPQTPAGARENGGFWYALNGPLVLGVAEFDRDAALQLLKQMTFGNYSRHFPRYWTGQWTAADSLDSSLLPSEGLSSGSYGVYCAHAHAWPLYCYMKLQAAGA